MNLHHIAYPDNRMVSEKQLTVWALDAVANGDTSIEATEAEIRASFELVKEILDDSGYATVVRDRRPRYQDGPEDADISF